MRAFLLAAITGVIAVACAVLAFAIDRGAGGEAHLDAAAATEPGRMADFRYFNGGLLIADGADRFDRAMRFLAAIMSIEERRTREALIALAALQPTPAPARAQARLAAPPAAPAPRTMASSVPIGQRLLDLINGRRAAAGLAPVAANGALAQAASAYAGQLLTSGTMSHTGPDGSTMAGRLAAAGFANTWGGEVIAWGTAGWSADAIVQAWMDSAQHRVVILSANLTVAGAACVSDGSEMRCVVDFAG